MNHLSYFMSLPFIIVKGQPKALLIEKIEAVEHGVYAIKFKNSSRTYHYRKNDVVFERAEAHI